MVVLRKLLCDVGFIVRVVLKVECFDFVMLVVLTEIVCRYLGFEC